MPESAFMFIFHHYITLAFGPLTANEDLFAEAIHSRSVDK